MFRVTPQPPQPRRVRRFLMIWLTVLAFAAVGIFAVRTQIAADSPSQMVTPSPVSQGVALPEVDLPSEETTADGTQSDHVPADRPGRIPPGMADDARLPLTVLFPKGSVSLMTDIPESPTSTPPCCTLCVKRRLLLATKVLRFMSLVVGVPAPIKAGSGVTQLRNTGQSKRHHDGSQPPTHPLTCGGMRLILDLRRHSCGCQKTGLTGDCVKSTATNRGTSSTVAKLSGAAAQPCIPTRPRTRDCTNDRCTLDTFTQWSANSITIRTLVEE